MSRRHGLTGTPEHQVWKGMIQRATNSRTKSWANYGGRGITVLSAWRGDSGFENFRSYLLETIGLRPSNKFWLDRKNNDGNYEPGNIRWATRSQQMKNRRSFARVKKILPDSAIAELYKNGWSLQKIADKFKVTIRTINLRLIKQGVERRSAGRPRDSRDI